LTAARGLEHCQREPANCPCPTYSIAVYSGHCHIAIANGLYLVGAISLAQFIECANEFVEISNDLIRRQIVRRFRESD
jgi:hypothetical protein